MSEAVIVRVRRLDCPLIATDWLFARERADDIARHWAALTAHNPALFNGRVLLCRDPVIADDCFSARYFEADFAAFIAWRDFGFPGAAVFNCFGMAALQSSDGAFLLGEMAAHTSTAGQSYFPAGTPDLSDIVDGRVDLAGSVARELREETGIDIKRGEIDPVWTIVKLQGRIACLRAVRLPFTRDVMMKEIERFLRRESEPELARMHGVSSLEEMAALRTPDFIKAYLTPVLAERARNLRPLPKG